MHLLLPFVLMLGFTTCAHGLEGWRKFIKDSKRGELDAPPTASWTIKGDEIVVQVTNQMNTTLVYAGYDPAGPQLFFEELREGKWVDTSWNWCGTGMEIHKLPPKGTCEFRLEPINDKPAYRIYAAFGSPDWEKQSLVLIYSTEKPQDSK